MRHSLFVDSKDLGLHLGCAQPYPLGMQGTTITSTAPSNRLARQKSSTYGGAVPEKLPGRGKVARLQERRVSLPKLHYTADKGCQAGVIQGVLGDDGGALAQEAAGQ